MPADLSDRYLQTRRLSQRLCEPLAVEDFVVQSMPDASPTRWHLAHTTWFFETFVLAHWNRGLSTGRPAVSVSVQFLLQQRRRAISPCASRAVDSADRGRSVRVPPCCRRADERRADTAQPRADTKLARVVELGINHEQQHQELMLTDIKHAFSCNPLWPAYRERFRRADVGRC